MEYDLSWLEEIGIDVEKGLEYTRHIDKYIELTHKYYKSYENNYNSLQDSYSSKDWRNYCITAHSLKSNSRMIGISSLADKFEKLEHASKSEDVGAIDSMHDTVLNEWSKLVRSLSKIEDYSEDNIAEKISSDEAKKTAHDLMEALDDFDDVSSKKLAAKLSGYSFTEDQKKRLDEASDYIDDFLYDDALEIIRELSNSIG